MKAAKLIQVFEYEILRVGTRDFTSHHFELMAAYLDKRQGQYFQLGHNSIRFTNYVGVIQVQNLVIEVLPKTGKISDKEIWRDVLIEMLWVSGFLNITATSDAQLRLRSGTLLDLYYRIFLNQCRQILNEGLLRQYIQQTANRKALKGRLLFKEQLKHNLVRKERFVTSAQDYIVDNIFNQILLKALSILRTVSNNSAHRKDTKMLLYQFDDVSAAEFSRATFERLKYGRATERYRRAIWIAELIIMNYLPDIRGGNRSVLAIMFPMEALYEAYVAALIKRASRKSEFKGAAFKVETQSSERFWRPEGGRSRTIRPDIVIDWSDESDESRERRVVIDTKWKLPGGKPADADLKQMFVYNKYFESEASNLLYPTAGESGIVSGKFLGENNGSCSMWPAAILDGRSLNRELGSQLLSRLISK